MKYKLNSLIKVLRKFTMFFTYISYGHQNQATKQWRRNPPLPAHDVTSDT